MGTPSRKTIANEEAGCVLLQQSSVGPTSARLVFQPGASDDDTQ